MFFLIFLLLYFVFFFLMLRRPPRSTLFSYMKLIRSRAPRRRGCPAPVSRSRPCRRSASRCPRPREADRRSEEHTSELQSRENLVCRLLLEKKKKENI